MQHSTESQSPRTFIALVQFFRPRAPFPCSPTPPPGRVPKQHDLLLRAGSCSSIATAFNAATQNSRTSWYFNHLSVAYLQESKLSMDSSLKEYTDYAIIRRFHPLEGRDRIVTLVQQSVLFSVPDGDSGDQIVLNIFIAHHPPLVLHDRRCQGQRPEVRCLMRVSTVCSWRQRTLLDATLFTQTSFESLSPPHVHLLLSTYPAFTTESSLLCELSKGRLGGIYSTDWKKIHHGHSTNPLLYQPNSLFWILYNAGRHQILCGNIRDHCDLQQLRPFNSATLQQFIAERERDESQFDDPFSTLPFRGLALVRHQAHFHQDV